jgi:hypothetical protein
MVRKNEMTLNPLIPNVKRNEPNIQEEHGRLGWSIAQSQHWEAGFPLTLQPSLRGLQCNKIDKCTAGLEIKSMIKGVASFQFHLPCLIEGKT